MGSLDSNYTPHLRHQNAHQVMMLSFPQLTEGSTVEHLRWWMREPLRCLKKFCTPEKESILKMKDDHQKYSYNFDEPKKKAWDISEMQWLAEIKVTGESTRWSSWMTRPSQEINHWCQPPDDRKSQIDGISPDDPMTFIITKVAKSLGRKLTITGRFLLFCGAKCQGSWFLWGGITLDANGCQNGHFEGAFPTKKSLSFLSYCWWLKSCTSWYGKFPIIHGVLYIPGGSRSSSINGNPSWGIHPLPQ